MTIMNVKMNQKFFKDLVLLILGVGLNVLSLQLFVIPNALASNGLGGFSVLLDFVFGINPALTFFIVNIPLFLIGWRYLSPRVLLLSIPGALSMSLWMLMYEALGISGIEFSHLVFAGISDGILSGIGAGLAVLSKGTFGGSILLGFMLEKKLNFKLDKVLFFVDVTVLTLSLLSFLKLPNFGVTLLSCYIFSKVTLLVGRSEYRKAMWLKGKKVYRKVFAT